MLLHWCAHSVDSHPLETDQSQNQNEWKVRRILGQECCRERNRIADPEEGYLWINERAYPLRQGQLNAIIREAGRKAGIEGKKLTSKMFRKTFVKHALESGMRPMSLIGTGKAIKTCFCVGWTGQKAIDTIMTFYAPQLHAQIEKDREKFKWC